MDASTLKNHLVWKPRDPLNLEYLKINGRSRKKVKYRKRLTKDT
jgi:hypothetical protein